MWQFQRLGCTESIEISLLWKPRLLNQNYYFYKCQFCLEKKRNQMLTCTEDRVFVQKLIWRYLLAKIFFNEVFCKISCAPKGRIWTIRGSHCFSGVCSILWCTFLWNLHWKLSGWLFLIWACTLLLLDSL